MIGGGGPPLAAIGVLLALALATLGAWPVAGDPERRIVVLVPGITGVELLDRDSGEVVWGRGRNLLGPGDGGYRLAVPVAAGADDRLVVGEVIERLRIGWITKPIYAPLIRAFEARGWRRGDLEAAADESGDGGGRFFPWAYDWRRDLVAAANDLAGALERLAAASGPLSVSLICQSNGGHLCRYLVKYGGARLEEAERGDARQLDGVSIERLVLVGTANGGSLRTLGQIDESRRYVPAIGRTFRPEVFSTFESLYQDLPWYRSDLFVDAEGASSSLDLYDVDTWRLHGWGLFDPQTRARVERRADLFGDREARESFVTAALDRAERLHALLDRDVPVAPTRYWMIQNRGIPTPDRALLRRRDDAWETLVPPHPALERLPAVRLLAPGDGHAPMPSQEWLTASEKRARVAPTLLVDGRHFEMIVAPESIAHLLEVCSPHPGPS